MTDALARCCTICMVSWESCAMLTRWRTAVQYAGSYRSGSNFRQKGVRNDHLEMLKAATVAAAPRQQQQCWIRPCNDSGQLREIEVSIGANKKKRASLVSTPAVTSSARSRKMMTVPRSPRSFFGRTIPEPLSGGQYRRHDQLGVLYNAHALKGQYRNRVALRGFSGGQYGDLVALGIFSGGQYRNRYRRDNIETA